MYLEKLAPAWREFHHKLLSQTSILVVDDEEIICELLGELLGREGFTIRTAHSTGEAWQILVRERIDLAVVDKNLPDESGLSLIRRIRDEKLAVPSVLITGYASAETVAEALDAGASDYISKPFDDIKHLVARLRGVIDRQISRLLFDVMIQDLTCAVQGGAIESQTYADLSRELIAFKLALSRRPQVLIVDSVADAADHLEAALRRDGLSAIITDRRDEALSLISEDDGPLVAVVGLQVSEPIELIRDIRRRDRQIEILATSARGSLEMALAAVTAGAADYALRDAEGPAPLTVRVKRLLRRARRHRLYLHLIATLYRAAKEANPDLADGLIFAAGANSDYVKTPVTRPALDAIDADFGSFEQDYHEGSRIMGNPLGNQPLRRKRATETR